MVTDKHPIRLVQCRRLGTSADVLDKVETELGVLLPADYRSFMMWSNGVECSTSDRYLSLWPAEEVTSSNRLYEVQRYLPKLVGIGTNGGDICYALDYRNSDREPTLVEFDLGDKDYTAVVNLEFGLARCLELWFGESG